MADIDWNQRIEAVRDMDQHDSVERIKAPTLVIAGSRDQATPPAFAPIEWQALKDPAGYHGATDELIDRALEEARIQEND